MIWFMLILCRKALTPSCSFCVGEDLVAGYRHTFQWFLGDLFLSEAKEQIHISRGAALELVRGTLKKAGVNWKHKPYPFTPRPDDKLS